MDLSMVIPAYNESRLVGHTVRSVVSRVPAQFGFEIIVVDHGSTDATAALAKDAGAIVVDGSGVRTIAALRNVGVANTTGRILVFLDADITLSESWAFNIGRVVASLDKDPRQIIGSNPRVPDNTSPLIKGWFEPKRVEVAPTHIGSCHLIISRTFFSELGGFPEAQETSEEFLLCLNARKAGAKIVGVPELEITHHGAPKNLRDFMTSEIWHGRGDWNSVSTVLSSRVAIASLMFVSLHAWLIAVLIWSRNSPVSILLPLSAIAAMCVGSAILKFAEHGIEHVIRNSATFYFYFFARSLSLFSALRSRKVRKRSRNN
jgi:glycosyltransferase involved in cell wall biosynthesis